MTLVNRLFVFLICGVSFFAFTPIIAQVDNYDISQYYRPNLHREQLILVASGALSNFNSIAETNESSGAAVSTALLTKSVFANSDSLQLFRTWSGFGTFNYSASQDIRSSVISLTGSLNQTARYYHKPKRFIELDIKMINTANRSRLKDEIDVTIDNGLSVNSSAHIAYGFGRTEFVTDAWHAATILEFLQKQNLIQTSDIPHELITEMAVKISEVKNKRFTDPRFFFINEYEEMIQFLQDKQLIELDDVKFYGHFFDVWRNERFIARRHGRTFRTGLGVNARKTNLFSDDAMNGGVQVFFAVDDFKAVDKDWQFNKFYGLELDMLYTDAFSGSADRISSIRPYLNLELGYFPSLRTNFRGGLNVSYEKRFFDFESTVESFDDHTLIVALNGRYTYYVSPQLTWVLDANFNVFHFGSLDILRNNNSLSFTTIYAFF